MGQPFVVVEVAEDSQRVTPAPHAGQHQVQQHPAALQKHAHRQKRARHAADIRAIFNAPNLLDAEALLKKTVQKYTRLASKPGSTNQAALAGRKGEDSQAWGRNQRRMANRPLLLTSDH